LQSHHATPDTPPPPPLLGLQAVVNIMTPVGGPRIREALSQSVTLLFKEYTNAMNSQFNHYRYEDGTLPKVLGETPPPPPSPQQCHERPIQPLPL